MNEEARQLAQMVQALDEAPCGLARTAEDGTFLHVNTTFCRWVGRGRDELVGRLRMQDLLTMGGRIFHQTHWAPLLRMQGSVSEVKLEIALPAGSTLPVVLNALRRDVGAGIEHHLAIYVARDRDAYERELVLSRRRLEAAVATATRLESEAKDRALFAEQMIGIVSHDLRNPLSVIHSGTELLARLGPTPQQQGVIDRIHRAEDRARRLIRDLLDFTQARLGQGISVALVPLRLHKLVADAADDLSLAFRGRAIQLQASGDAEVRADPDRLVQLLGNLVGNAMTYGHADTPVTVSTVVDDRSFKLMVHNEGAPIPEELRDHLFQPLSRGQTETSAARSVGLGLYIVSEIAKAHGGRVTVDSTELAGTTFTVEIPRVPVA